MELLSRFAGYSIAIFCLGLLMSVIGHGMHKHCRRKVALEVPALAVKKRIAMFWRVEVMGDLRHAETLMDEKTRARAERGKLLFGFGCVISITAGFMLIAVASIGAILRNHFGD
jgi:hypothetical protein